ncbi:V-type proton ATPase subunit D, putative [Plasmodium ovale wallikeri]|uniref:V-type proton ATPase subunit D, putative n=1 Tax=Plasmodium ovale wallikeri TaxID=864142 RepID=A0A1A8Z951_PLAOA|nr:V-type proton ATPase subunit D, putative [Plasmodium ovale wallikeri]SBT40785.1 V-type proton ATPase subunit D, putative [Plasmodium ovale wallikeri]
MGALDESTPVPSRMLKEKGSEIGNIAFPTSSNITKTKVGEEMRNASFSLAKAVWAAGDFKGQIIEGIKRPVVTLSLSTNNVAGVKLPIFQVHIDPTVDVLGNLGVAAGGQVINNTRENYLQCLNMLVKLASMQVR